MPAAHAAFSTSTRRALGSPPIDASLTGVANSFASFLLDWPNGVSRDLKVIDQPGTQHSAVSLFTQDKWQARPNITIDMGLRWEYYTPLTGLEGQGSLSNYDPATNTLRASGYGNTSDAVERQEHVLEPQRANWRLLAPEQRDGVPGRLRWQHHSVSG